MVLGLLSHQFFVSSILVVRSCTKALFFCVVISSYDTVVFSFFVGFRTPFVVFRAFPDGSYETFTSSNVGLWGSYRALLGCVVISFLFPFFFI